MDITERGHIAFNNPEQNAAILIAKTDTKEGEYLVSAFNGNNYTKWNVYTAFFYGDELQDFIMEKLEGWFMDKMNGVDINVSTGYDQLCYVMDRDEVMNEIVSHAIKKADDNDYTLDTDMLETAVLESAKTLQYFLTAKLLQETIEELKYEIGG